MPRSVEEVARIVVRQACNQGVVAVVSPDQGHADALMGRVREMAPMIVTAPVSPPEHYDGRSVGTLFSMGS